MAGPVILPPSPPSPVTVAVAVAPSSNDASGGGGGGTSLMGPGRVSPASSVGRTGGGGGGGGGGDSLFSSPPLAHFIGTRSVSGSGSVAAGAGAGVVGSASGSPSGAAGGAGLSSTPRQQGVGLEADGVSVAGVQGGVAMGGMSAEELIETVTARVGAVSHLILIPCILQT